MKSRTDTGLSQCVCIIPWEHQQGRNVSSPRSKSHGQRDPWSYYSVCNHKNTETILIPLLKIILLMMLSKLSSDSNISSRGPWHPAELTAQSQCLPSHLNIDQENERNNKTDSRQQESLGGAGPCHRLIIKGQHNCWFLKLTSNLLSSEAAQVWS